MKVLGVLVNIYVINSYHNNAYTSYRFRMDKDHSFLLSEWSGLLSYSEPVTEM